MERQSQGGSWGGKTYDSSGKTISQVGCALTSLSTALKCRGVANDPGTLNDLLTSTGGFSGSSVSWDKATRDAGGKGLKFLAFQSTDAADLDHLLCNECRGCPVIVGVNLQPRVGRLGAGHFVAVTGRQGSTFRILDPGYKDRNTLDAYGNVFETRGCVVDPPGDISALEMSISNSDLLLENEVGQKAGTDSITGRTLKQIPRSVSFIDALDNDVSGQVAADIVSYIHAFQPSAGVYRIFTTPLKPGPHTLIVNAFSQDGTAQPQVSIPVQSEVGSRAAFRIKFSPAPGTVLQVVSRPTSIAYTGARAGDFHDSATLAANLVDTSVNPTAPVAGVTVSFTLGSQTCTATTDASGQANCSLTFDQAPGNYTVAASFAGTDTFLPSSSSAPVTVTREETTLTYTGETLIPNGRTAQLAAVLKEDGTSPIAGRTVSFTLGIGPGAQVCSGTTDATGSARCTISPVSQPLGPGTVTASFAGDGFYVPTSASASTLLFAFLDRGSFVTGDRNTTVGKSVVFFGEDWDDFNLLSEGEPPDGFKGFALATSTNPPACGGTWSSKSGNTHPPVTVPSYMAVLVSGSITKAEGVISGNIPAIAIVNTDSGLPPRETEDEHRPASDHSHGNSDDEKIRTATVVAMLCRV